MDEGAAGVMIAPPPHLRTDDQITGYYAQAVEAIGADVPFVIQDYPLTLTVQMTPGVIRRIVQDNPSCVMLKHEDWPGLEKISALRRFQAEGSMRAISILTGNGGLFLDFEMERGADGAMTGYAFPEMLADVVRLQKAGRRDEAHDLFDAHLPLLRYEQQPGVGLAVRKYVLMRRGLIASDAQRKPASALSPAARQEVDYLLARLARRDSAPVPIAQVRAIDKGTLSASRALRMSLLKPVNFQDTADGSAQVCYPSATAVNLSLHFLTVGYERHFLRHCGAHDAGCIGSRRCEQAQRIRRVTNVSFRRHLAAAVANAPCARTADVLGDRRVLQRPSPAPARPAWRRPARARPARPHCR